jgi:hypothetical protein
MDINLLPEGIKNSKNFTTIEVQQITSITEIPFIDPTFTDDKLKNIFQYYALNPTDMEQELHSYAKELLAQNKVHAAWQVLLAGENV